MVGNLVVSEAVSTLPAERRTPESCLAHVAGWTEAVKRRGPQTELDALASMPHGPVAMRRAFFDRAVRAGQGLADSAVLSDVGRVVPGWIGHPEFDVIELWFSPLAGMPTGIGLGVAATDDALCLSLRYRPTLLSAAAAAKFADLFAVEVDFVTSR